MNNYTIELNSGEWQMVLHALTARSAHWAHDEIEDLSDETRAFMVEEYDGLAKRFIELAK